MQLLVLVLARYPLSTN